MLAFEQSTDLILALGSLTDLMVRSGEPLTGVKFSVNFGMAFVLDQADCEYWTP